MTDGAGEMRPSTKPSSPRNPPKRTGGDREASVAGRRVAACLLDCSLAALLTSVAFSPLLVTRPTLVLMLVLALFFVLLFCAVYLVHAALLDGCGGQTVG